MSEIEPADVIERKVTRYICPHCNRGRSTRKAALTHMKRCWRNPDVRGCRTCGHYQPVEGGDYESGYPGCPEGCDLGVDITYGPKSGCSEWVAKP